MTIIDLSNGSIVHADMLDELLDDVRGSTYVWNEHKQEICNVLEYVDDDGTASVELIVEPRGLRRVSFNPLLDGAGLGTLLKIYSIDSKSCKAVFGEFALSLTCNIKEIIFYGLTDMESLFYGFYLKFRLHFKR